MIPDQMIRAYSKIKKISIIGAGSWGTAVAKVIAENRPDLLVLMWAYEKATVNSINTRSQNTEFLPGVRLPSNIKATSHLSESVENTKCIIIATPSKVIPDTVTKLSYIIKDDIPIAYLTKGFCRIGNEILTISQSIAKVMPSFADRISCIYGPSHAEEVVNYYHTCLTVAGKSEDDRKFFMDLLNCDYISCRETADIIGVDLGGTLKNPAAIAAGIISRLPRCGDNLAGALMAESLKEMLRLGRVMGGEADTIVDITGTGDLVATALSDHSRNRRFGKEIAGQILEKGTTLSMTDKIYLRLNPDYVLEKMAKNLSYLAEGAYAIEPLMELADRYSVAIPVYRSLYEVLLNKKEPSLLIETIKDPDRFHEIYATSKMHVKEKKKGLEKLKGKYFKKIILARITAKYLPADHLHETGEPDIVNHMKKHLQEREGGGTSLFFRNELKLITSINAANAEKVIRKLSAIYLKQISDQNNPLISRLFLKALDLLYIRNRMLGYKNRIKITGEIHRIFNIKERFNTLYVMRHKNVNDFFYYLYAIKHNSLSLPRFFVPDTVKPGFFYRYILRRSGGFIVHTSKLENHIYRECLIQYLSALISHGVPVLFFPELKPATESVISSLGENFFQILNGVMFQESTEIALVPGEISYNNLVNESAVKPVMKEAVTVNFSNPLFLSDFTRETNMLVSVPDHLRDVWIADEVILPHHILCGMLEENNYIIQTDKLKKGINRFINSRGIVLDKNRKHIFHEGMKFLVKNGIVSRKDNYITSIENETIKRLSSVINMKAASLEQK